MNTKRISTVLLCILCLQFCIHFFNIPEPYVVGQLSSPTRHSVLAVAALDKSLSLVWWRWHISVSQLCCYWAMAVSFWVASINVCACFGVPSPTAILWQYTVIDRCYNQILHSEPQKFEQWHRYSCFVKQHIFVEGSYKNNYIKIYRSSILICIRVQYFKTWWSCAKLEILLVNSMTDHQVLFLWVYFESYNVYGKMFRNLQVISSRRE